MSGKAPITETLAAALILLTPWKKERILVDPFCGSGTFVIEAAMIAANMAPGMNRNFAAEKWINLVEPQIWNDTLEEAREQVNTDIVVDIQGYDIQDGKRKCQTGRGGASDTFAAAPGKPVESP